MPRRRSRRLATLRPTVAVALLLTCLLATAGCEVHRHRVGTGAAGVETTSVRQWYLGFGYWELNEVDSQRFAEESTSYDIQTEHTFSDMLISLVLSPLTVTTRTVTVSR